MPYAGAATANGVGRGTRGPADEAIEIASFSREPGTLDLGHSVSGLALSGDLDTALEPPAKVGASTVIFLFNR